MSPRSLADGGLGRLQGSWAQLWRFGIVGTSGYLIDLAVFALATDRGVDHLVAATLAFVAGVANNFFWNRRWTFDALEGSVVDQVPRCALVSLVSLAVNLTVLALLLDSGVTGTVGAQALAVAATVPLNFLGNKLWAFA